MIHDQATPMEASDSSLRILRNIAVHSLILLLTYSVVATISSPFVRAQDQIAANAEKSHALSVKELNSLYDGRTWVWDDGAAYFSAANRGFTAWTGKEKTATYGEGSWSVSDQGRLCWNARWHSLGGNGPSTTCFEHRSDNQNIYQRKLPQGKWYLFGHTPALADDLMQKLQPGDHVSEDYQKNKRYLAEHKDQIATDAAKARALTAEELNSIYQDRTWPWEDGAAYFRAANRGFIAWVGKGTKATYADGSWSVNDQGRLCYSATWHGLWRNSPWERRTAPSCFEHRRDDETIYKRSLPHGKWYVFSHAPALPDDEIRKLQPGDHVSEDYQKSKRYLAGIGHSRKKI
jgi:uncharacterized protein DUF995